MQSIITYVLIHFGLGCQNNVCLKNSILVVKNESKSTVLTMLEFSYKSGIF